MDSRCSTEDDALFEMYDPLTAAAFRGDTDSLETFRYMDLAQWGDYQAEVPVTVRHGMGRKLLDFIWVSGVPLIHDRVVRVLTEAKATGWATYRVDVFDKNGTCAPGYHGLTVVGRCDSMFLDKDHSELIYREYPKAWAAVYKGLYVTRDSWDGSDVFKCRDGKTRFIVVTETVRMAFEKAKVSNVRFKGVLDVEVGASDQPIRFKT